MKADIHLDVTKVCDVGYTLTYEYRIYEAPFVTEREVAGPTSWCSILSVHMSSYFEFANDERIKAVHEAFDRRNIIRQLQGVLSSRGPEALNQLSMLVESNTSLGQEQANSAVMSGCQMLLGNRNNFGPSALENKKNQQAQYLPPLPFPLQNPSDYVLPSSSSNGLSTSPQSGIRLQNLPALFDMLPHLRPSPPPPTQRNGMNPNDLLLQHSNNTSNNNTNNTNINNNNNNNNRSQASAVGPYDSWYPQIVNHIGATTQQMTRGGEEMPHKRLRGIERTVDEFLQSAQYLCNAQEAQEVQYELI